MTDRVRVGMNLMWLRPGIVGGSEVAAVSTVDALDRFAADDVDLTLYAQRSFVHAHPRIVEKVPTRTVDVPGNSRGARVVLESAWLPRMARRDRVDVVHYYGGVMPPGSRATSVLTVHDVQPLETSAVFEATKKAWLNRMIPSSVKRAAVVVVPSAFVRDRMVALVDVDPDKIVVVPHGLDTAMTVEAKHLSAPEVIRHRFRLDAPYVLYPAITYPHKNHTTLLRAFAETARRHPTAMLVLAGGTGKAEHEVVGLAESLGVGDRIRRIGRVSTDERDVLLREAAVLAFPSRYEGFGLPILEAFSADTPVVASSAGSLPEVVGDAGVLIDPDDVEGWSRALDEAIEGAGASSEASRRRAAQAARFGWQDIVPRLVASYRRALTDPRSRR